MAHIVLPKGKGREVVGGIIFTDGVADADLGPNMRRYFTAVGATITDPAPTPAKKRARRPRRPKRADPADQVDGQTEG